MKCTYHWLKEFVDFDLSPEALGARLTLLGLEVDGMESVQRNVSGAVVGRVEKKNNPGRFEIDIGAKANVEAACPRELASGLRVVIQKDKKSTSSEYRVATYESLGIASDRTPVYVSDDFALGAAIDQDIPESDTVYDIDLTPNRPDCLSIVGIAREIATYTGNPLRFPTDPSPLESSARTSTKIKVNIDTPEGCPRYAARYIGDVNLHPSLPMIYDRLVKTGVRPINNLVDMTNYVLMELGFPLHAFDYDLIQGQEINVRLSRKGEQFETLDGKTHKLPESTVMICDQKRAVALAGIMGGLNTEVNQNTKNILLECAYFAPAFIHRSARQLGISTEASTRFGRGVDPNGIPRAIDRAAALIAAATGGQLFSGTVDRYVKRIKPAKIRLRKERVAGVLGIEVPAKEIRRVLTELGCAVAADAKKPVLEVEAPTGRPDLLREIDLIEEISRIVGYDAIPERTKFPVQFSTRVNKIDENLRKIRGYMIGQGYFESISNSMISEADISLVNFEEGVVPIRNPISEDMALLRPSLLPSLLKVAQYNLFRQIEDVRIFEIGSTYAPFKKAYTETKILAGILTGNDVGDHWHHKNHPLDFYDLKGLIEGLTRRFGLREVTFDRSQHAALGSEACDVVFQDQVVGAFGAVKTEILQNYDLTNSCLIFELNLDKLIPSFVEQKRYVSVPKYPWVRRDLALVLDLDTPGGKIINRLKEWGGVNLKDIDIFDVYAGRQVPIGKKSIAFTLRFQSEERTLTEKEVNEAVDHIIAKASQEFDAKLRN